MAKEARARIKINKLLEEAGWRFLADEHGPANITLETGVSITPEYASAEMGDDFEKTKKGYTDYMLVGSDGFPVALLEAKRESIHPLNAKEQAREYATAAKVKYVILSNGNLHYLWELERGDPQVVSRFPSPRSLGALKHFQPDRARLVNETVGEDYIALTQLPNYARRPEWSEPLLKPAFIEQNKLRFLRPYQLAAVQAIQRAVEEGKDRFLFEMATGTGKTLTSGAIIKLFLRTGNARRVLFLVDRLELEDQAKRAFLLQLKNDFSVCVHKEDPENWKQAEVVVSTVQSLLIGNKYRDQFEPTDFDLIISDEAHRSIGGNSRAVFEYFHGYKLGLTATPRDFLKGLDDDEGRSDPRALEIRLLKDTYTTFGCNDGTPTFRYSLLDGVRDGFLVNPVAIDARTEITTRLLSDDGYAVLTRNDEGGEDEETFVHRDFERKFFSEETNLAFCNAFVEHAALDPISGEMGKSIVFCVSQRHALKVAQLLNQIASARWPGRYQSDFAVQVTSLVGGAQQMTINFSNNQLLGTSNVLPGYRTSKARVCVTVGMMTTGYDCEDLLNVVLMRPIFSPSDFVQMKGRGTRRWNFKLEERDAQGHTEVTVRAKDGFKLFDFFANCEFFENEYDYDAKLAVSVPTKAPPTERGPSTASTGFTNLAADPLKTYEVREVGALGMKVDREMFRDRFEDRIRSDQQIKRDVQADNWDQVLHYIRTEILNKPEDYFTLEKLRKAYTIDRKLSLREVVEKIFGIIADFKMKDELLEEEFQRFVSIHPPGEQENITALRHFFKAYIVDQDVREIIRQKEFQRLASHPAMSMDEYKAISPANRQQVPSYVDAYVSLEQFAA
ncbi:MAG: DEAD/DEAH box helicase family protein [Bacteroidetes bacterium]|nr:DEAD/DEAH box helicase family protein [Bacteroidota bacterium]